jgi:hypothetical protein
LKSSGFRQKVYEKITKKCKRNERNKRNTLTYFIRNSSPHLPQINRCFVKSIQKDLENFLEVVYLESKQYGDGDDIIKYSNFLTIINNVQLIVMVAHTREKYRMIMFNMNDPNNIEIRQSICKGEVSFGLLLSLSRIHFKSMAKKAQFDAIELYANQSLVLDGQTCSRTTLYSPYSKRRCKQGSFLSRKRKENDSDDLDEHIKKCYHHYDSSNDHVIKTINSFRDQKKQTEIDRQNQHDVYGLWSTDVYDLFHSRSIIQHKNIITWNGIGSFISDSSNTTRIRIQIQELSEQGSLGTIMPKGCIIFANFFEDFMTINYLEKLDVSHKRRSFSFGKITAIQDDRSQIGQNQLEKISTVYKSSRVVGWTNHIINGDWFEFYVIPSHSRIVFKLLNLICNKNEYLTQTLIDKLDSSELLLFITHSEDFSLYPNCILKLLQGRSVEATKKTFFLQKRLISLKIRARNCGVHFKELLELRPFH